MIWIALLAAILFATSFACVKVVSGLARRRVARDGARLDAALRQLVRDEQQPNRS